MRPNLTRLLLALTVLLPAALTGCIGGAVYLVVETVTFEHNGMSGSGDPDDAVVAVAGHGLTLELGLAGVAKEDLARYELRSAMKGDLGIYLDSEDWAFSWTPRPEDVGTHVLSVELWDIVEDAWVDSLDITVEVVLLETYSADGLIEFGFLMPRDLGSHAQAILPDDD